MKTIIKKTPILGPIILKVYNRLRGIPSFSTSDRYWEERYKRGGNSGLGSYDNLAEFKAETINKFVVDNNISSAIEFGCGDGNQLKFLQFKSYLGYDVSETVVQLCRDLYKSDPSKKFKLTNSYKNEKADLTLSLDVIYHLVEDVVYLDYMKKLFNSSKKYVIIYSSNSDDHENNGITPHVKHRKFTNWVKSNAPDFQMIKHIPNIYPYDPNKPMTSYADFYFFEKHDGTL